jgi:hypothetical protein
MSGRFFCLHFVSRLPLVSMVMPRELEDHSSSRDCNIMIDVKAMVDLSFEAHIHIRTTSKTGSGFLRQTMDYGRTNASLVSGTLILLPTIFPAQPVHIWYSTHVARESMERRRGWRAWCSSFQNIF